MPVADVYRATIADQAIRAKLFAILIVYDNYYDITENANITRGKIEECQDQDDDQDVVRCVNLPSRQKIDAVNINETPASVVKSTEERPRGEIPLIDEDEDSTVDYGRKGSTLR